jgi:hypothetical protein
MDDPEIGVRAAYDAQREAMVAGDAEALGALLADGFRLTHMTGHVQSREEWLADLESGSMTYHAIEDVEVTVSSSVLTVRSRTEATIWGGHGTWPLRLRIRFVAVDGDWLAAETVASTW